MKIQSQRKVFVSLQRFQQEDGFTVVQALITLALIAVVSTFALMAVGSARASMRLSGSTRELAAYLEKARSNAVRRHGESVVTFLGANTYSVFMDFDGDGTTETRIITLQQGVIFSDGNIGNVARFDWRGRLENQLGIVLNNERGSTNSIHISGSGDVTLGSEIFQDSAIADVTLNSDVPSTVASATPNDSHPGDTTSPTPTPTPNPDATPTPTPNPDATPTPTPNPTPTPTPTPNPTPTPTPTATPTPTSTPTSTPTPVPCTLTAPSSLALTKNAGSGTFTASIANGNSTTITATRDGKISTVSPTSTTVSGSGNIQYTVTYSNGNGTGTVTLTSSCGTKVVNISVN